MSRPVLRIVCAWCGAEMRSGDEPASHGICPPCERKAFLELAESTAALQDDEDTQVQAARKLLNAVRS